MRISLLLVLLACGDPKPKKAAPAPVVEHKKVDDIAMTLPAGWTSSYAATDDKWTFTGTDGSIVTFERTPEASAASPEALRQWLRFNVWDKATQAEIEKREPLNDGFAVTFGLGGKHETYVIRQIYPDDWFRCFSTSDQTLELCKSLKRPKRR
jgi:hypothetical protein